MEPYYSTSLSHFKSTKTVASIADLTAYASANGYSPPPAINLTTPPAEGSGGTCANCGGAPKNRCAGCAEGVDRHGNHAPTYYCGKECQQEHWQATHKLDCKIANHRKKVYRAGAILQPAFEAMHQLVWYENIKEIKWGEHDGQKNLLVYKQKMHTNDDAREFPDELVPDERARRSLLAHASGDLALEMMGRMLADLLKGVCVESQIQELGLCTDAPLEVQLFSNGEAKQLTDNCALHWFFGVTLANGERYAVDLCASQFASLADAKPLSCVEPLQEHAQSLAPSAGGSCFKSFGFHRQVLEEGRLEATQEERAKSTVRQFDVDCLAQKLAMKHLEEANKHWLCVQSTTLNKALGLPTSKFTHIFCTIVWPIELMARKLRKWEADPSTIVSEILGGAKDLKEMGF